MYSEVHALQNHLELEFKIHQYETQNVFIVIPILISLVSLISKYNGNEVRVQKQNNILVIPIAKELRYHYY